MGTFMKEHLNTIIIAITLVIVAAILGHAWKVSHLKTDNTINVTGLATKNFTSDLISWQCSFSRKSSSIKDSYQLLKRDSDIIREYLRKKGVDTKEAVFSAIDIQKEFKTIKGKDKTTTVFDGYRLIQTVNIESKEVAKIEEVSRSITELIDMDIELTSREPTYLYTKLAELKIEMIAKATADARNRAEQIAKNAGNSLGDLTEANMGVFQITGQNSTEEFSAGGAFNTTSKNKTASVTARLQFDIR
jgi:hypothetical protein